MEVSHVEKATTKRQSLKNYTHRGRRDEPLLVLD